MVDGAYRATSGKGIGKATREDTTRLSRVRTRMRRRRRGRSSSVYANSPRDDRTPPRLRPRFSFETHPGRFPRWQGRVHVSLVYSPDFNVSLVCIRPTSMCQSCICPTSTCRSCVFARLKWWALNRDVCALNQRAFIRSAIGRERL